MFIASTAPGDTRIFGGGKIGGNDLVQFVFLAVSN